MDLGAPVAVDGGEADLVEDAVDDGVEDLALVRDVVVERHRLHAEVGGEGADRQRVDSALVGDGNGARQDAFPAQLRTFLRSLGGLRHVLFLSPSISVHSTIQSRTKCGKEIAPIFSGAAIMEHPLNDPRAASTVRTGAERRA